MLQKIVVVGFVLTVGTGCVGQTSDSENRRSEDGKPAVAARHSQEGDESGFLDELFDDVSDDIGSNQDGSDDAGSNQDGTDSNQDGTDGTDSNQDGADDSENADDASETDSPDSTPPSQKPNIPGQSPGQSPHQGASSGGQALRVLNISYGGSGCPEDSVAINISDDQQAFTMLFAEFVTELLEGAKAAAHSSCRVRLNLDVPHGWQVSYATADMRGIASVAEGQAALFKNAYEIGSSRLVKTHRIDGVGEGETTDFEFRDSFSVATQVWSACGGTLPMDITMDVSIVSPESNLAAIVAVDSLDGEFTHKYGLSWRRCN